MLAYKGRNRVFWKSMLKILKLKLKSFFFMKPKKNYFELQIFNFGLQNPPEASSPTVPNSGYRRSGCKDFGFPAWHTGTGFQFSVVEQTS